MTISKRLFTKPESPKGWSIFFSLWNYTIHINHGMIKQLWKQFLSLTKTDFSRYLHYYFYFFDPYFSYTKIVYLIKHIKRPAISFHKRIENIPECVLTCLALGQRVISIFYFLYQRCIVSFWWNTLLFLQDMDFKLWNTD